CGKTSAFHEEKVFTLEHCAENFELFSDKIMLPLLKHGAEKCERFSAEISSISRSRSGGFVSSGSV
ncbi:hypothetical protein, partial [Rhizobium johnstonii]|uniref:hypothetical protein n=1 Tax=Rhizobium johnstonii TaxID=3019933 RepID=UPI003F9B649D